MHVHKVLRFLLTLYSVFLMGFTAPSGRPLLYEHYSNNFSDIKLPTMDNIKNSGKYIKLSRSTKEELFESVFIVLMKKAPIIYVLIDEGVVLAPPYAVNIEEKEIPTIYVYFMDNLYRKYDDANQFYIEINLEKRNLLLEEVLGQIATQLQVGEKIKPGKQWFYLFQ